MLVKLLFDVTSVVELDVVDLLCINQMCCKLCVTWTICPLCGCFESVGIFQS
jgi:hypothetical protein